MELSKDLSGISTAVSELIAQHIRLARVELKEDAQQLARQVGQIAAFAPLILVGYTLLCVAAALFLRRFVPADAAFLIIAGLNLIAAAVGILMAVRKLKEHRLLNGTREELEATAGALRRNAPPALNSKGNGHPALTGNEANRWTS